MVVHTCLISPLIQKPSTEQSRTIYYGWTSHCHRKPYHHLFLDADYAPNLSILLHNVETLGKTFQLGKAILALSSVETTPRWHISYWRPLLWSEIKRPIDMAIELQLTSREYPYWANRKGFFTLRTGQKHGINPQAIYMLDNDGSTCHTCLERYLKRLSWHKA